MKDEIKTFDEYKALVREYKKCDSLSRRKAIENAVFSRAKELLHELTALYAKYGRDYVNDSDYREDRGGLSLVGIDEDEVWMNYYDHWAYGGECDFDIEVKMKYLDIDETAALEKELYERQVLDIKRLIQEKKAAIEKLKKEVEELETELAEEVVH